MLKILKTFITVFAGLILTATCYAQLDSSSIPVRLSYFEASSNTGITTLNWKTACFLDFANFQIQKSVNGNPYTTINSFSADRLRCEEPFNYTDNNNNVQGRVLYRISVGDLDGKVYQSKIISVFTQGKGFAINSFLPTIVTSTINFSLSSAINENIKLMVINMQGNVLLQKTINIPKGASTQQLALDALPTGRYFAVFLSSQGEKNTVSFTRQ